MTRQIKCSNANKRRFRHQCALCCGYTVAPTVGTVDEGGVSGFFDRIGSTLQGVFGAIDNLGDIIDTAQ